MKTLLIFGIETVAGANIALTLSGQFSVVGVAEKFAPEISGCQILTGQAATATPARLLADVNPDLVLDASCCGDSAWNPQANIGSEEQCQASSQRAEACARLKIPFTLLSSDAVLTGPWMFHEENSSDFCTSVVGQRLGQLEKQVQQISRDSLIVRSHPFGWSPETGKSAGWVEQLLTQMRSGRSALKVNLPGYATPILASELADILQKAWNQGLTGLIHVAGAERVNRLQFTQQLAECFGVRNVRIPLMDGHFSQEERRSFACGEISLQTREIRRALGVSMPRLRESLETLHCQQENGYLVRLCGEPVISLARAA